MDRSQARNALANCCIFRDADGNYPDFHTLRSGTVEALLEAATERRYRAPANANGSRARYFYQMLVRKAT